MIEYLYDAIRAVAGQDITVTATITDDTGYLITDDCEFTLHNNDGEIYTAAGTYLQNEATWAFFIPAEITKGLKGRFWYCVRHNGINICFKQPMYLI